MVACLITLFGCPRHIGGEVRAEAFGIANDIKDRLGAKRAQNGGVLDARWTVGDLYGPGDDAPAGEWWKASDFELIVNGPDSATIVLVADSNQEKFQMKITSVEHDEYEVGYGN